MSTPVIILNSSPATCGDEPMPPEPMLILPVGLAVGDELRDGLHRHVEIDVHDVRHDVDARDRDQVLELIVVELLVEVGLMALETLSAISV